MAAAATSTVAALGAGALIAGGVTLGAYGIYSTYQHFKDGHCPTADEAAGLIGGLVGGGVAGSLWKKMPFNYGVLPYEDGWISFHASRMTRPAAADMAQAESMFTVNLSTWQRPLNAFFQGIEGGPGGTISASTRVSNPVLMHEVGHGILRNMGDHIGLIGKPAEEMIINQAVLRHYAGNVHDEIVIQWAMRRSSPGLD
jgi:hypothetical protein